MGDAGYRQELRKARHQAMTPCSTSGMRTPTELAHGWRAALVGRDPDAYAELFAEDAEFIDVEHRTPDGSAPRRVMGRAAIRVVCVDWLAATPAFDYEVLDVLGDDSRAAK